MTSCLLLNLTHVLPFLKMQSMFFSLFLTVSLALFSFHSNPSQNFLPVVGVKSTLFLLRDVKHLSQTVIKMQLQSTVFSLVTLRCIFGVCTALGRFS